MAHGLPHLRTAWQVEKAVTEEESRVVLLRFGHDYDPECKLTDDILLSLSETVKEKCGFFLVDTDLVPDFTQQYELYDPCTLMFFFKGRHLQLELGLGERYKITWPIGGEKDTVIAWNHLLQELLTVIEAVHRGAQQGRDLIVAPQDRSLAQLAFLEDDKLTSDPEEQAPREPRARAAFPAAPEGALERQCPGRPDASESEEKRAPEQPLGIEKCDAAYDSAIAALAETMGSMGLNTLQGLIRMARVDQERQAQEAAMLNEALSIAAEAFETADFNLHGELDLQSFMQALGNPRVAEKVSQATSVPAEWFLSLDVVQMVELFQDIDADANGKVSFSEWILALLRVRQANHEEQKAERQQELAAIESLVEEAMEEGDEDWSGELDFREFIAAFRCNPRFVRKVALAADTSVDDLNSLASEDLEQFFAVLDTDRSGTISFEEFVNGLLDIRLKRHVYSQEQAEAENQAVIDVAYLDALDAFSQADLGVTGELDLDGFHKALQQPAILEKVALASQLPPEFFSKLSKQDIKDMFARMDTDCSGGISFNEWVAAIVNTRQEVYLTEKLEQENAIAAVMGDAAAAMDEVLEDWSGEFELQRFIDAFQTNKAFVQKVSHATGIPAVEYQRMQAGDLKDLFDALDMDFSGTVSFSEFVEGLAAIRRAHEAAILEEVPSPTESAHHIVKDAMVQSAPTGMDSITPTGLKQLLLLLDADRWTPGKLEKLIAGLPWKNGALPLSNLVDVLY
ncbi:Txnl4a [Symbiodinium natans]|uniref:Txnl4a protein n=1 Tax=Symbiodinium natans TaxID=878477 RepID=A0A812UNV7_9DINO|nr:Txnl4a [Symbiodinium natans]